MDARRAMKLFYERIGDMAPDKPMSKAEITLLILDIIKEYNHEHIKNCPHGLKMQYNWKMAAVVLLMVTVGSGVGTNLGALIKLLIGT